MNKTPMRAYLYCRVATEEQLDGAFVLNAKSARLHVQAERQELLDTFQGNPPELDNKSRAMNYGRFTAGTTKTAIDTA